MRNIIAFIIVVSSLCAAFAGEPAKPACVVVGFANQLQNVAWQDARVGMGVRIMLSQALSETGLFVFLEEKPEMQAKLDAVAKALWAEKNGTVLDNANALGKEAGAAFTASGKVFFFGKPRTKASVGPAHFESDEVEIKVEVTLKDTKNNKTITAIGIGKAATSATSGIFTFHGENLDVSASLVGTATQKAIAAAVEDIVKKYRKVYKVK